MGFGLGCLAAGVAREYHANFDSVCSQRLSLSSLDVCHRRDARLGRSSAI